MKCERCGRETDIIKHIGIHKDQQLLFSFNNSREGFVCVECWNNKPEMRLMYEIKEIRNG